MLFHWNNRTAGSVPQRDAAGFAALFKIKGCFAQDFAANAGSALSYFLMYHLSLR